MLKPTKHATTNYKALAPFLETVDASEEQHVTFTASGYMPLSIERLYSDNGLPVYSMMHWISWASIRRFIWTTESATGPGSARTLTAFCGNG